MRSSNNCMLNKRRWAPSVARAQGKHPRQGLDSRRTWESCAATPAPRLRRRLPCERERGLTASSAARPISAGSLARLVSPAACSLVACCLPACWPQQLHHRPALSPSSPSHAHALSNLYTRATYQRPASRDPSVAFHCPRPRSLFCPCRLLPRPLLIVAILHTLPPSPPPAHFTPPIL